MAGTIYLNVTFLKRVTDFQARSAARFSDSPTMLQMLQELMFRTSVAQTRA